MYNKPIIIHTLEYFQNHPMIDAIVVVCIESWIPYLKELLYKFRIGKVKAVVPGGETGQLSIFHGLKAAKEIAENKRAIVLIHDGVRPLITEKLITDNIESVKMYGSAITSAKVKETILVVDEKDSSIDLHLPWQLCLLSGEEAGENGQSESRNTALEESLPQGTRLDAPSASGSRTQGEPMPSAQVISTKTVSPLVLASNAKPSVVMSMHKSRSGSKVASTSHSPTASKLLLPPIILL